MKLLKSKLLIEHDLWDPASVATASTLDFVRHYRRKWLLEHLDITNLGGICAGVWEAFLAFVEIPFILILFLLGLLTAGWILAPLFIYRHRYLKRKLVEKYGVEWLNATAAERVKLYMQKEKV